MSYPQQPSNANGSRDAKKMSKANPQGPWTEMLMRRASRRCRLKGGPTPNADVFQKVNDSAGLERWYDRPTFQRLKRPRRVGEAVVACWQVRAEDSTQ